jgi:cell division protein FtsN
MGERKDLRDLLRDTDFTQKRIIDDLAGSDMDAAPEREVSRELRRNNDGGGDFMKNIFVGLLLVGIVVGSFWVSFLIGKKVLVPPVKTIPTIETQMPSPKPITTSQLDNAVPVDEETPIPEHEIGVSKKAELPKPVLNIKKVSAARVLNNAEKKKPAVQKVSAATAPVETVQAPVIETAPIETVKPAVVASEKPVTGQYYKVIVGSYRTLTDAKKVISSLKVKGFQTFVKMTKSGLYRVQAGAFDARSKAAPIVAKLKAKGYSPVIILE